MLGQLASKVSFFCFALELQIKFFFHKFFNQFKIKAILKFKALN